LLGGTATGGRRWTHPQHKSGCGANRPLVPKTVRRAAPFRGIHSARQNYGAGPPYCCGVACAPPGLAHAPPRTARRLAGTVATAIWSAYATR